MRHPGIALVACALVLTLLAPAAAADTISVTPADDVQAVIDGLTGSDHTIVFKSGTYVVNLVIPPGLDGLTLRGAGKVFLDGYASVDGIDTAVIVQSPGVTLTRLTIRHAADQAVQIADAAPALPIDAVDGTTLDKVTVIGGSSAVESESGADGTTITGCTFTGLLNEAVKLRGVGITVDSCRIQRCGSDAVNIVGDQATVDRCTIELVEDGEAIRIEGDDATVTSNTTVASQNQAVLVQGDRARIEKNRLSEVRSGGGIEAYGDQLTITSNQVERTGGAAIEVAGHDVLIERNQLSSPRTHALLVYGIDVRLLSNRIDGTGDEDAGVFLRGLAIKDPGSEEPSIGALVYGNRVENAFGHGFDLLVADATVERNQAEHCGTETEGGFRIHGDGNTIERNTARDCTRDGFLIIGNDNTLVRNAAQDCTVNGFEIDEGGADNLLDGNSARGCVGQGLVNEAVGTRLVGNRFQKNRLDVANDTDGGATLIDEGKNKIGTGGDLVTPPDVDVP